MLTVDFSRLGIKPGTRVLDLGCGAGRHSFEAFRRGALVIAADLNPDELASVNGMLGAMGYDDSSKTLQTMAPLDLSRVFEIGGGIPPRTGVGGPPPVAPRK